MPMSTLSCASLRSGVLEDREAAAAHAGVGLEHRDRPDTED